MWPGWKVGHLAQGEDKKREEACNKGTRRQSPGMSQACRKRKKRTMRNNKGDFSAPRKRKN